MTRHLAFLALMLLPAAAGAQGAPASPAPAPVDQLRWLAGCWELRTPTRTTLETWNAPDGGLMLGTSRTVVRGVAREFEFLRLETRDGVVQYVAQPGGRAPTAFAAREVSDSSVVFENMAHDFPQRILYRRRGADSLVARIEGPQGGTTRGIDFPMRRVACG